MAVTVLSMTCTRAPSRFFSRSVSNSSRLPIVVASRVMWAPGIVHTTRTGGGVSAGRARWSMAMATAAAFMAHGRPTSSGGSGASAWVLTNSGTSPI